MHQMVDGYDRFWLILFQGRDIFRRDFYSTNVLGVLMFLIKFKNFL